ncbi:MAG: alpha/beta fold hydrolase [Nanoarchaeota archaeon]|nr:alpha/beta fold hydrolase [Nanoarchaeota archaeon]
MRVTNAVAFFTIMILLLSCIAGCKEKETTVMSTQEISPLAEEAAGKGVDFTIETGDYKTIKGTFYNVGADKTAILIHMMVKDRHTWDNFVPIMINAGYNVVAYDSRGHGESSGDWQKFIKQDFTDMYLDVKAVKQYLGEQGVSGKLVIIGASIGANVALKYATTDEDVKAIVMLSPGTDYRGVTTKDIVPDYRGSIMFVVSSGDSYSVKSATELYALAGMPEAKKTYVQYSGNAHGTDMFIENPLADDIVEWLKKQ